MTYHSTHRYVRLSTLTKGALFVADSNQHRDQQLLQCREWRSVEQPSLNGISVLHSIPQGPGSIDEGRAERLRSEGVNEHKERVFSGYNKTNAHLDSLWLWPHTQDQHILNLDRLSAWIVELDTKTHPYLRSHWWFVAAGRGEHPFSLKMWVMVGSSCCSGWPHTQEIMASTNWTWWVKNKTGNTAWCIGKRVELRVVGGGACI